MSSPFVYPPGYGPFGPLPPPRQDPPPYPFDPRPYNPYELPYMRNGGLYSGFVSRRNEDRSCIYQNVLAELDRCGGTRREAIVFVPQTSGRETAIPRRWLA